MGTVFRTATKQAILEMIQENAVPSRQGLILTEESCEQVCHQIVDLFEMTLELRQKASGIFASPLETATERKRSSFAQRSASSSDDFFDAEEAPASFPKTKSAAEIYYMGENKKPAGKDEFFSSLQPHLDHRLPRKRFALSDEEKRKLGN